MQVVLSHTTAFRFWRFFTDRIDALRVAFLPAGPRNGTPLSDEILHELEALGVFFSAKHPLHLLYAEQEQRPKRPDIIAHVHAGVLPPGAILRLTAHICIVSPQLCFTQLACTMTPERLALAGSELSAAYALAPVQAFPTVRRSLRPSSLQPSRTWSWECTGAKRRSAWRSTWSAGRKAPWKPRLRCC